MLFLKRLSLLIFAILSFSAFVTAQTQDSASKKPIGHRPFFRIEDWKDLSVGLDLIVFELGDDSEKVLYLLIYPDKQTTEVKTKKLEKRIAKYLSTHHKLEESRYKILVLSKSLRAGMEHFIVNRSEIPTK